MERYQNNLQDQFGNAIGGVTVTVRLVSGGALATLFSDDGVTGKTNPFTNDTDGEFFFYASNNRYNIFFTGPITSQKDDVILYDPAAGGAGITDGTVEGQLTFWDNTGGAWTPTDGIRFNTANQRFDFYSAGGTILGGSIAANLDDLTVLRDTGVISMHFFSGEAITTTKDDFRVEGGLLEVSNAAGTSRVAFDHDTVATALTVGPTVGTADRLQLEGLNLNQVSEVISNKPTGVSNTNLIWTVEGAVNAGAIIGSVNANSHFRPMEHFFVGVWSFNTPTAAADPTSGFFRFNNASPGSVTAIYIDDNEMGTDDGAWFLDTIESGDILTLRTHWSKSNYFVFKVNGPPVDNTGWWTIPVFPLFTGAAMFANSNIIHFELTKISIASYIADDATSFGSGTQTPFQLINAGQSIKHVNASAAAYTTYTNSESNQTVIPDGAQWEIKNDGAGALTILGGTSVTLYWWAGAGSTPTTGTRTLARGGICTVRKVSDSRYEIFGNGIT